MYLHIGKDFVIEESKIIGIFDIDSIRRSSEYKNLYENIKNDLIDISEGSQKTLVLINDKKGYITNIASTTLKKRMCN